MNILFCCQFYAPSVGGVQELIRQLSERFVQRGHTVTVATTALENRKSLNIHGVHIKEFDVHGNLVTGMSGDVDAYREFVQTADFDLMLVYAAQQWTFDALWSIWDDISYPVVFAPCGFSGFYELGYASYYRDLAGYLDKFDYFIFNASEYRDIEFILSQGEYPHVVIANAANEKEFNVPPDDDFRKKIGVRSESFVFLSVGSMTGLKGHLEVLQAFEQLHLQDNEHATLILNGNNVQTTAQGLQGWIHKLFGVFRAYGFTTACVHIIKKLFHSTDTLHKLARKINVQTANKQVMITDLDRKQLVQMFFSSNLFVFASKIEHSPLVLFESAAAGLPFLSVNVGNAKEIAAWTGAGVICPSWKDKKGYTYVDTSVLSKQMEQWMHRDSQLMEMSTIGRQRWSSHYTWERVSLVYEKTFQKILRSAA